MHKANTYFYCKCIFIHYKAMLPATSTDIAYLTSINIKALHVLLKRREICCNNFSKPITIIFVACVISCHWRSKKRKSLIIRRNILYLYGIEYSNWIVNPSIKYWLLFLLYFYLNLSEMIMFLYEEDVPGEQRNCMSHFFYLYRLCR